MKIDKAEGAAIPALDVTEILRAVPGLDRVAEIEAVEYGKIPGPQMSPERMLDIANMIKADLTRDDIHGIVLTHGTDTLEETAFFLDLIIDSEKPIIVTGAMKNRDELGWDGPPNLMDSVLTAVSKQAKGKGVLVVMHNEIHAASEVKKTHTEHIGTFQSLDFGPLGIIEKDQVLFYRRVIHHSYINTDKIDTSVDLIKTCAGMDDRFLRHSADSGAHGIVLEGLGRGNVPPKIYDGVKYVIQEKGLPVVLVSRCPRGRVLDTYAYYGGGKQLRKLGVIFGENLPGHKARIKLMLALGKTQDYEEIRQIFEGDRYAKFEVDEANETTVSDNLSVTTQPIR